MITKYETEIDEYCDFCHKDIFYKKEWEKHKKDCFVKYYNYETDINLYPKFTFKEGKHIKSDRLVGIEIETIPSRKFGLKRTLFNLLSKDIGRGFDAGGIELKTPPLSGKSLEDLTKHTTKLLRRHNFTTSRQCGLHIHLDGKGFVKDRKIDFPKLANLASIYYLLEPYIFEKICPKRKGNCFCSPLTQYTNRERIKPVKDFFIKDITSDIAKASYSKYNNRIGFTINNLWYDPLPNIELRYHHGSIDSKEILNWIEFNVNIFDNVSLLYDRDRMLLDHIIDQLETKPEKTNFYLHKFLRVPLRVLNYYNKK